MLILRSFFQYYRLRYRGNNSSHYQYKTVYDLNQTSVNVNIAASTETRYTLMIKVQTRHGSGKWAQTTISTVRRTIIGPVTQLKVTFPHKNEPSQVLLSWKAPSTSSPVQWVSSAKMWPCFTESLALGKSRQGTLYYFRWNTLFASIRLVLRLFDCSSFLSSSCFIPES